MPSLSPLPRLAIALALSLPLLARAEDAGGDKLESPAAKGLPSAEQSLKGFSVTPGLKAEVWAAEPLLANPVALSFDEKGRCFVAETYRRRTSVPDIRTNMDWLIPDLAFRSVEDRVAFLKAVHPVDGAGKIDKGHPDLNKDGRFDWRDWEVESERIQLVEDRHGAGKADTASVFAEGFNKVSTGIGAGVLARNGQVWYACVPDLWHLEAENGSTTATKREPLLTGFGVHVAYSGHDMHGVKMGPDGRIYWSIADLGAHVTTKEGKVIDTPDMGAVFRANPDGTDMELFAKGLRNPQSLAFNDLGDLFTGDNNADGGDKARWEHVVEGGDYGWRIGWQFLPKLGAWNSEKLWELDAGQTALYLLPPVGHVGHGPAGIAYYPGTGMPEAYLDHFFYADFPGGVRAFSIKPKGASYTLDNPHEVLLNNSPKEMNGKVLWSLYPSDVAFSTDGGVYVLDWVFGWEKTGKGRIYRVHDPEVDQCMIVLSTKELLAEGMNQRPQDRLADLLGHPDQRVRTEAQFALAAKGATAIPTLAKAAKDGTSWTFPVSGGVKPLSAAAIAQQKSCIHFLSIPGYLPHLELLARLHAIWGLGQIARKSPEALAPIAALLQDKDAEIRAQAAKVLGEFARREDLPAFLALLRDPAPRPRFFAAQALAKLHDATATQPLIAMLRDNASADAFLRYAGVSGLAACAEPATLAALSKDGSSAVRAGALLALRRLRNPAAAVFLEDSDPLIVREAARAIHDEPIDAALPALAALVSRTDLSEPVARRAVDACYLLGTKEAAQSLATLAGSEDGLNPRLDALDALAHWNTVLGRDRVLGTYRPLPPGRDAQAAATAAASVVARLLAAPNDALRLGAAEAAGDLRLRQAEPALLATADDPKTPGNIRAAALKALAAFDSPKLGDALKTALADKDKTLLQEARRLSAKLSPHEAAAQSAAVLEKGSIAEKQSALQTLGTLPAGAADQLLTTWLDRLLAGHVPPALQLDVLEAAGKRADPAIKQKVTAYEAARKPGDPIAHWRECLEGGDAKIGREIFAEKAEVACMRCHKVAGVGGDVGPDLAHIGAQHDREYLLVSVVLPNAMIAPGFESTVLTLKDKSVVAGLIASENAETITITPIGGGAKTTVKKSAIAERASAPSPMPEGLASVLGKRDLRNVVEYLSSLK